ncbi:exodeoxyribonuclease-3 [Sphingobium sp. B2D3A]|uniref:exodeoxyribonuclease III n=1 Tax=unclassified Sphingobium TaxID=2611147 RepID=UPI002224DF37|nr:MULTISPECIES: exodeoxyribonuclease III [unclassified Sphingobium]MCW2335852.1 exodeoxyribonuclease-3 [Sphingobium sp. B2D3A]MCW2367416.1 exodeoxyribonuclease-3 [Sphingobium sp. B7D2B]MCW2385611.1 exodeoxyribonuclease-3 [Sphingobium sp. B2D3D]MCW2391773.1 exodeoxyribonuclease-3 [Sphingobium sp. B11D3A]MCW2396790.1 exodeoxyribonuclease-3 [Sphingobium sp. B8D3B]
MRIATFNINGIKARLPRLVEWLTETQPDVACLQEIKTQDEGFPIKDIEDAGYGAIWHGQKGFNGVAILAKGATPQEVTRGLEGEPEDEHSRYIEADVNGVRIASIYLPNGNPVPGPKFEYKLRWMARLRARAAQIWAEEVPAVLAGDYNVIPFDRDVWSPPAMASDALMQPESRAAYKTLLNDGWTDALAARHPLGGVWTFWDYQAGAWQRDAGFRIDHLLLSPTAADRLADAQVDKAYRGREKASDHAPVWVRLKD